MVEFSPATRETRVRFSAVANNLLRLLYARSAWREAALDMWTSSAFADKNVGMQDERAHFDARAMTGGTLSGGRSSRLAIGRALGESRIY